MKKRKCNCYGPAFLCYQCEVFMRLASMTGGCPLCRRTMVPTIELPDPDCTQCEGLGRYEDA